MNSKTVPEEAAFLADDHTFYDPSMLEFPIALPLPNESHVEAWRNYEQLSQKYGVWETLKEHLIQLQFPLKIGQRDSEAYQAAIGRGKSPEDKANGLELVEPEKLHLTIHPSIAGAIPVLTMANRVDFITLVCAFTAYNEPIDIPHSMGACMVAGYINWDRIHTYRARWEAQNPQASDFLWQMEFRQKLLTQKHLYQDRFVILTDGPYSSVSAVDMKLDDEDWRKTSLRIRLEHECAHYFTKRLFGTMRNHPFDELFADYWGLVQALGYYRSDYLLRFMGLESFPAYREGGRLQNYIANLDLNSSEFQLLKTKMKAASENLAHFDAQTRSGIQSVKEQALILMAICSCTLTKLASHESYDYLCQTLIHLKEKQNGREA